MDVLISDYLKALSVGGELRAIAKSIEEQAEERAENAQIPKTVRPATPGDIYVGSVIWYSDSVYPDENYWCVVEQVLNPECDFKAYVAICGARYGLQDAFVEVS
jgi:hypothetical protein